MKNREQLWEDYEEARFALLMDALAEAEGEEALRLSEALNRDPEGALPPEVDRRCEAVIREAFVQRRLHATGRTAVRWLTKVLVAAMLGAVMFAAAFALSEDVRVATLNTVIKVMDDRTQITFESADGDTGGTAAPPAEGTAAEEWTHPYSIALEWVPEGFELEKYQSDEVSYRNDAGDEILVSVDRYSEDLVYTFDTEDRTAKTVEVQGHRATLYSATEKKLQSINELFGTELWSDRIVVWMDDANQEIWFVYASNLTEEEMLRLAEGVRWRGAAPAEELEYHYNIALEWVPEGYKVEGGWSPESGYCDEVRYTNEIGLPLSVNITRYDAGLVYTFDTEDRAQKAVEVQGRQATLYSTNEGKLRSLYEGFDVEVWSDLTVFWKDDETQSLWLIDAINLTEEEMLRLAEGVRWRGAAPAEELEYHYNIALEWVPEGFELEGGIEGGSDLVSYLSPVDGLLEVSVTPYSQSSVYNLNTEGCTKQEITVQGHPAELYVTGEEMLQKRFSMTGFDIWSDMMIYWIDENNRVIVQIDATNLTEEEMLRLAEGFHWGGGQ